ncbi:MAG: hypothetical protein ACUVTZ_01310 [Armatimonadota bacterium]
MGSSCADDSAVLLREALALVKSGRADEAWSRLAASDSFSAEHVPALLQIGQAFQADGLTAEAADVFARCLEVDPANSAASGRLSALLRTAGLPVWIRPARARYMPVAIEPVRSDSRDFGTLVRLLRPASAASDPRYDRRFPYHLWAYSSNPSRSEFRLKFVLHVQREMDMPLAAKCARVLLAFADMARSRLGLESRFADDGVVHVWLTHWGKPGGEQWQQHIYLYSIDTPRQPIEWVRQLAHEFGHLVIPGIRLPSVGEEWANGLIGERLFVKWMHEGGLSNLWEPGTDLAPLAVSAAEMALDEFAASPPIDAHEWTPMRLVGFVLYIDTAHGHDMLREVIRLQSSDAPAALLAAYKRALQNAKSFTVRIADTGHWLIFVPDDGEYFVNAGQMHLLIDGRRAAVGGPARIKAGWHRIATVDGSHVAELKVVRRHSPSAPPGGGKKRG